MFVLFFRQMQYILGLARKLQKNNFAKKISVFREKRQFLLCIFLETIVSYRTIKFFLSYK